MPSSWYWADWRFNGPVENLRWIIFCWQCGANSEMFLGDLLCFVNTTDGRLLTQSRCCSLTSFLRRLHHLPGPPCWRSKTSEAIKRRRKKCSRQPNCCFVLPASRAPLMIPRSTRYNYRLLLSNFNQIYFHLNQKLPKYLQFLKTKIGTEIWRIQMFIFFK